MELGSTGNQLIVMAAHHSYEIVCCPSCKRERQTRKDLVAKAKKAGKELLCRSCAIKTTKTRWNTITKKPEDRVRNQGAYKSYCKAKRRVKTNHKNAYAHVEFRFESYEQFLQELGPRPDGLSLDRINPMGHYEPGNVRWATAEEQAQNRNPRYTWVAKRSGNVDV